MNLKNKRVFYNKLQMNNNLCYECMYYLCPKLINHICKNNDSNIDEYETDMLLHKNDIVITNQPVEHKIEIDFDSNQLSSDNLQKLNTNNCKITLDSDNSNLYNNDIKKIEVSISDNSNLSNNNIENNMETEVTLSSDSDISNLSDYNSDSSKFAFSSDSDDSDFCILIEK